MLKFNQLHNAINEVIVCVKFEKTTFNKDGQEVRQKAILITTNFKSIFYRVLKKVFVIRKIVSKSNYLDFVHGGYVVHQIHYGRVEHFC
jgi:hypothetical protein